MKTTVRLNIEYFVDFNAEKATEIKPSETARAKRSASFSAECTTIIFEIDQPNNNINYVNDTEQKKLTDFLKSCIELLSGIANGGYTIEELTDKSKQYITFDIFWNEQDLQAISTEEKAIIDKIELPTNLETITDKFKGISVASYSSVKIIADDKQEETKQDRKRPRSPSPF